jgi:hypothetical protein
MHALGNNTHASLTEHTHARSPRGTCTVRAPSRPCQARSFGFLSSPHASSTAPPQGLAADGVMTFWETAVPLVARVAEKLGCALDRLNFETIETLVAGMV